MADLKTIDGGRNWALISSPLDGDDVLSIATHPTISGKLFAVTRYSGAFRSTDFGATWVKLANYGTIAELTNVSVTDPSNALVVYAGTEGYGVFASGDSGQTFAPRVTGLTNYNINAIAFDPSTPSRLYAASDNGVFKSTDSANSWTTTGLSTGEATDIAVDNEGAVKRIWITVRGEGVAYSSDGGASFTLSTNGIGSLDLTSVELEIIGAVKRIWITSHGGSGVAFSDDFGQSWISASGNGLTDRDVNDLSIENGTVKRIWITCDSGVFFSEDHGLSWSERSTGLPADTPVTSVSIDPNSNEVLVSLYSQDGGGVYRGGNTKGSWSPYSSGLTELRVRKLTNDRGHAIDATTAGTRFFAATIGDGAFASEIRTTFTSPAPTITTPWLRDAFVREAYSAALQAQGGIPPYAWSLKQGALPPGLDIDPPTGAIAGEAGQLGHYEFTLQVVDSNNRTAAKEFVIDVISADKFHVVACTPENGVRGASLTVQVGGSGFVSGATAAFGDGVTIDSVTFVSATRLDATVSIAGAAVPGWRTVTVTNPGPVTATLANGFKVDFPTPTIGSISPTAGSQKQTLDVSIYGTFFDNGATVSFGDGVTVNSVTWVSATELRVNVSVQAAATLGVRTLTVTNSNGYFATLAASFTVRAPKPAPTSSSPNQGNQSSTLTAQVLGGDFVSGATVSFGVGITVGTTTFVSASRIDVNVTIAAGATLGYRTVTVTNPDAQSGVLANGFQVRGPAPQLTSVTPANGTVGTTLDVDVNGTTFQAGASSSFGAGVTVNSTTFVSSTKVRANVTIAGGATLGFRDVTVTNGDGQASTKTNAFEVRGLAPTVTLCNPNQGSRGSTMSVTITGTNFRSGAASSFGAGIMVNSTTLVSATQLTANITLDAAGAIGFRTVTVTNSDTQAASLSNGFEVKLAEPTINTLSPAHAPQDALTTIVVKGAGFQSGAAASFGSGITVQSVTFVSATQLSVQILIAKGALGGTRTVTVTNPDAQQGNAVEGFTVDVPDYCWSGADYQWIDVSGGISAGVVGDDVAATIPIGFDFPFYGALYQNVTVASNGYLTFGGTGTAYQNTSLPDLGSPNALVAVFWDDLAAPSAGLIRYQVVGSAPNRKLVVGWLGVSRVGAPGHLTFEAVLSESAGIFLAYQDVMVGDPYYDNGKQATVGVEDALGSRGAQIAYKSPVLEDQSAYVLGNVNVETQSVKLASAALSWRPGSCGPYDVVRGNVASLSSSGGVVNLGSLTCVANDSAGAAASDATTPTAGQAFFYLVRPQGKSWGESTEGAKRVAGAGECP